MVRNSISRNNFKIINPAFVSSSAVFSSLSTLGSASSCLRRGRGRSWRGWMSSSEDSTGFGSINFLRRIFCGDERIWIKILMVKLSCSQVVYSVELCNEINNNNMLLPIWKWKYFSIKVQIITYFSKIASQMRLFMV